MREHEVAKVILWTKINVTTMIGFRTEREGLNKQGACVLHLLIECRETACDGYHLHGRMCQGRYCRVKDPVVGLQALE